MSGTWFVGSQHAVLFSLLSFSIFVQSLHFFVPSTKRNEPLKIMTPFSRYKNCSFFIAQSHRMLKQQHQNNRVKYSKKTHSIKKMIKENQNGTKLYLMWCFQCDAFQCRFSGCIWYLLTTSFMYISSGRSILDSITFSHHSLAVRLWSSCVFVCSFFVVVVALWACYEKIQLKTNKEIAIFFFFLNTKSHRMKWK